MTDRLSLEAAVISSLLEHIAIYRRAIPTAIELSDQYDLGSNAQIKMAQLDELMLDAKNLEERSKAVKKQWSDNFSGQSEEVTKTSETLKELVRQLIHLTTNIEMKALEFKNNLQPQVSEQLKIKSAHAAYNQN